MENILEKITLPQNRYEQVETVAFQVLDNPEYFEALRNLPERCKAAALKLFDKGEINTYQAKVIRIALRSYSGGSGDAFINCSMMPFTDAELSR
jgi:hypothetical protein